MTVCGALTDGDERYPRPDGELCHCKEGWGGINCNGRSGSLLPLAVLTFPVCKNDDACAAFQTRLPGNDGTGNQGNETNDMVCYKGGLAIERNWQMCDVTSELPPPFL
jgi:hypothetical protein